MRGTSGDCLPKGVERIIEDSGTDDEHLLGSRTRPAHTGARQASLELFDAAFDCARTNGITLLVKFLVLHAALMSAEIMSMVR